MTNPILLIGTNLAIIAYLLIAWCWNLPDTSLAQRFIAWLQRPISYFGLWHAWDMFAPEPIFVNRKLRAVLYLSDGATIQWDAPDLADIKPFRAFFCVRERKYQENLMSGQIPILKPALCEHLVEYFRDQDFKPQKVELLVWREDVPKPFTDSPSSEPRWSVIYTHQVQS